MGSPVTAPVTFNGSSQYAQSLQQVITRSIGLASLPLQLLQNEQLTTSAKLSAAQSLQSVISNLSSAVDGLSTANSGSNTVSANVSDPSVIEATASAGALPGTYTVQVSDPGSHSTAMSLDALPKVTDPTSQNISASSSFTLTVGTNTFNIHPSGNNLEDLAAAINASAAGVQATIINIGGSSPDYRIALQNTALSSDTIQLNDGSKDLLQTLTTGKEAVYTVNGQPAAGISSSSNTVTIAPGLSVKIEAAGTSTVQVALSSASISNGLSTFVTAFNAAHAELGKSFGKGAGALSGDSIVPTTNAAVTRLISYSGGSGSIHSLTDLGIEFAKDGTLTFDSTKIAAFSPSQLADAMSFLGSASTGGFLATAANTMTGLLDVTTGSLPNEVNSLNQQFKDEAKRITDQQDKISTLQDNLIKQMNAADALIASLEQQTSFLTSLFNTMNANNFASH